MEHVVIDGVKMPRTRALTVGGEMIAREVQMASGKMIREVVGFRKILKIEWAWMPEAVMRRIHFIARQGGFVEVEYPDPEQGACTGVFAMTPPESGIFKFVRGDPMWRDVALTLTAREVE